VATALERGIPVNELPESDEAFHIETHGIDYIPLSERWATPRDVGGLWAGASVQIEYFIYGAILMTFGFTFAQALSLIIIGNLSYFLLGITSLQGPQTGTTVFAINRASYGPNGSRGIAFFNWVTQLGFEVEGIILIVGAALVLSIKAGFSPGDPAKVIFVIVAVVIQGVLPFLGHATMVKTLRLLTIPFIVLFAVLLGFAIPHATTNGVHTGADWQTYMEGLAFTITLSGLGWTECGNDYTRYCRPEASKRSIVGWVFLATAVPEILVMTLGAAVGTFLKTVGTSANAFLPFAHQSAIPAWFVVVFLIFCIFQLFAINSLDLYSSGVTLQAMGVHVKRYVAVVIDCVLVLGFTIFAVFVTSFSTFLKDFVDVVIVWIAPWFAIYVVDWALRKFRYVPSHLQRTGSDSMYYRNGGFFWPAIIAQVVGMYAAISALSATFHLPTWLNPITYYTRDSYGYGADFSVYMGIGVAGLLYLALAWRAVRREAVEQDRLLAGTEEGRLLHAGN
jgi:nucleobase:cation symporter-1, NCS1 family